MSIITRVSRSMRSDSGIALPTVIGIGLAMLIMVAGSMTVVGSGMAKTNTDEDASGALAAAYAGVEEYQSRLANDSTYQKYGDPLAPFTAASGSTVTLPIGAKANPAFGLGTTGTWADVPVSTGDVVTASYRYEIDNHDYQNKGVLRLRSTGRVGSTTRTVVVDLKQQGFIDYLYFTNYETLDPAYFGGAAAVLDPATGKSVCEKYAWEGGGRPASCTEIQFGANDTFTGPVRSNDRMVLCSSLFNGAVLSSSTTTPIYKAAAGCSVPRFKAGVVKKVETIDMPPTNTELKRETRNDLPSDVPRPGCLYTGPTTITYSIIGGVPKMTVLSPWTRFTNVAATKAGATNPAQCGKPGNVANGLGSPTGAVLDVLNLNLAFVQSVPAVGSDDANAPSSTTYLPPNTTCTAGSGAGNTAIPAGWNYSSGGTTQARFPMAGETKPYGDGITEHYGCRAGDLYVQGTLGGQTTLASENFIYVTGDLLYKDKAADMLGLVGNNAIFVWNPITYVNGSTFTNLSGMNNREIDAALLSVAHTFQVQNYLWGDRGTLTLFGAFAQKFRGTVAQGTNGFDKNYLYDDRFKATAPPKFLTPVSTTYGVTQFATVPPAFTATGAPG